MTGPVPSLGPLESAVLDVLWAADAPMTPGAVQAALGGDHAYTTVMTVLVRLLDKGVVHRTKAGRAYAYLPALSAADLAAGRLHEVLGTSVDPMATMSRFVEGLDRGEADALRRALDELDR